MAAPNTTSTPPLFVNGINGHTPIPVGTPAEEEARARDLARRYHCEFLDLRNYRLDPALLRRVPVEDMFRYNFVPLEEAEGRLVIAIADPSQLMMVDEIGVRLQRRIKTKVATL